MIQNKPGVDKLSKSLLISTTDDIHVRSCLNGKVVTIEKDELGYIVAIKSDSIATVYSILDSVDIELNDRIKKGDIVGSKNSKANENYIMFSVFIYGREAEAMDYLVRK